MTSHTAFSTRIAAAFLAIAFSANASFAQTPIQDEETRTVTVRYADLNLATEEGSRELYTRLVAAARQVCPAPSTLLALNENLHAQRCINDTVERAVKDVRNPRFAEAAGSYMR